jgi:general stress protein YciG
MELDLKNIPIEQLVAEFNLSKFAKIETGHNVQEWLKDHPEIKRMMEENGTSAMKEWNKQNRELIQEFARKGAEGSKSAWEFLRKFDPEGYQELGAKISQAQIKARQENPERYKEIDAKAGKHISQWIKDNPDKHLKICKIAQEVRKNKFSVELQDRYTKLWNALPQDKFSLEYAKSVKEELGIKGNKKFVSKFRDDGYLIKVHTGVNGSATNPDLYIKNPNPPRN